MTPHDFPPLQPRPQLLTAIHQRIAAEERRAARRRFVGSMTLAMGAAGACIPLLRTFVLESRASGFHELLALLISDPDLVLQYGRDVALAGMELLPSTSLALVLTMGAVCLGMLRTAARSRISLRHSYGIS
ncbi:hypothetical protein HY632_02865 [Candidatus Uhrbacteria bacterium]|nr:hypothetical protein [Candidatus Uhrbacteria bacterium]